MQKSSKNKRRESPHASFCEGIIFLTRKAKGFVRVPGRDEEIEIDAASLHTALHGDRVRVQLQPQHKSSMPIEKRKGWKSRPVGEVTEVLGRAKINFAGKIEVREGEIFFAPDDPKLYASILIPREKSKNAKDGDKVLVRIVLWDDPKKSPLGEVMEVLGRAGEHEAEMLALALEKGFSEDFPAPVLEEAKKAPSAIPTEEVSVRRDLRGIPTMTIDPKTAKDFDDALSVKTLPDGTIEIGVHIADVSYFVRPDTALDAEAAARGTSVYLVDRTIPMLPERLSNNLCSLVPNEDRLVFSAIFTFSSASAEKNKRAQIVGEWFGKSIIRSSRRFAYEEAQEILDRKEGVHYHELSILSRVAENLRREHKEKGAISFEKDELEILLDQDGVPVEVKKKVRGETHKMVEDFMLLANRRVAEFIDKISKKEKKLFVYRIHDEPNKEALGGLAVFVKALGYKLTINESGNISPKELSQFLASMEETPIKNIVHTTALRSMSKAVYSTKNIGHYGLAFRHYTHFTSPIRRYPDILAHRLLFAYLNHEKIPKEKWETYEASLIFASEREQKAAEAERDSIKYKQVEFMRDRVGEEFDGIITGVTEWGVYVAEKDTLAEGMVALRNLKDDYYIYDGKQYRLRGERTKKTYALGDEVRVRLAGTNMTERKLDWIIVK